MIASCLKCRGPMIRYGTSANGTQRIGCRPCGITMLAVCSYSRLRVRKPGKYRLAAYLLGMGKSTREVERMVGIAKKTVNDIRKSILRDSDVLCGCGQEAGHKGWCSFLYDRSPERQAMMTRWGRPPKNINVELINLLRAQGKPVREIAAMFKVDRNTIHRHLSQHKKAGRMPPWFCIGLLNTRTALSIKRYFLMHELAVNGESFSAMMNELWKAAREAGCPTCGAVRKLSNAECRRCITLRLTIRRIEWEIAGTIRSLLDGARAPLREFAESLAGRRGLSSGQRLMMLVENISGKSKTIRAEN